MPAVYDVADEWLTLEVRQDPWLRWWNHPGLNMARKALELSGQRSAVDDVAPTRLMRGVQSFTRISRPNSLHAFRFNRMYFASAWLKESAEAAGFQTGHAEVMHPGIGHAAVRGGSAAGDGSGGKIPGRGAAAQEQWGDGGGESHGAGAGATPAWPFTARAIPATWRNCARSSRCNSFRSSS